MKNTLKVATLAVDQYLEESGLSAEDHFQLHSMKIVEEVCEKLGLSSDELILLLKLKDEDKRACCIRVLSFCLIAGKLMAED